jgi:phosphonate transport system permease protein
METRGSAYKSAPPRRAFLRPPLSAESARWELLVKGLLESLQIAVLASTLGIVLALPSACRGAQPDAGVAVASARRHRHGRSFHPVIVAILFVKAVGFGALAGILALRRVNRLHRQALHRGDRGNLEKQVVRCARRARPSRRCCGLASPRCSRAIGFATYQLDQPAQFDDGGTSAPAASAYAVRGVRASTTTMSARSDLDHRADMVGELLASAVRATIDNATLRDFFRRGGIARSRERPRGRLMAHAWHTKRPLSCRAAQGANSSPSGAAQRRKSQAWGSTSGTAFIAMASARALCRLSGDCRGDRGVGAIVEIIPGSWPTRRAGGGPARMWPVDWSHYEGDVHSGADGNDSHRVAGQRCSLVLALPVGILAAHNLNPVHARQPAVN